MKGFNAGFTPYVGNIADLISKTFQSQAQQRRLNEKENYKLNQEKLKLEQEQALENQQNIFYQQVLDGDMTNFRMLTPEKRVAVNQEIQSREPKKLYQREDVPGKGKIWYEVTVPKEGEPSFRELSTIPTEARKDKRIVGDKQITEITYTDGKKLVTESVPAPKNKIEERSRREIFNDPNTNVGEFLQSYRTDIGKLKIEKANLDKLKTKNMDYTSSFQNAKTKLEIKQFEKFNSLADLMQDQKIASLARNIYDSPKEKWDDFVSTIVESYLEGGLDKNEDRTIQLLHNMYLSKFLEPSENLKPYIK